MTPRWLTVAPRLAGATAALAGATALAGWIAGWEPLREFVPGLTSTRANTALCVMLLGLALWQLGSPLRRPWPDRLARAGAASATLIALLTLCEYTAGRGFGIDELVFDDPADVAFPGRISPQTASALVLLGIPLLIPRRRFAEAKQACAAAAAVIALAALFGYAFAVAGSFGIADVSAMGVPGVIAVLALAAGILLLEPTQGVVGLFFRRTAGGRVARALVPAALVVPLVLGLALFVPETRGLLSDGVAASLFVVACMVAGATFVLLAARLLHRLDVAARATEARSAALVEHAPDAIVVLDVELDRFVQVNPEARRLFGMTERELLAADPVSLSAPRQPDGRSSAEAAQDYVARALAGATPVFEWVHRAADGSDVLCEIRLLKLPHPERQLVRGSLTDIRGRKQAEAELLALEAERAQLAERERAAAAVEAARLAAERATERIAFVQETTAALSQAASRDEIARAVLERAVPALGATAGAIGLGDPAGAFHLVVHHDVTPPAHEGLRPLLATTMTGLVKPAFVESHADALERYPELASTFRAAGDAVALVPLTSGESGVGALALGFAAPRTFTHEDRVLAVTLADLCAQALERAHLYEEERRVSLRLQNSLLGGLPRPVTGTDVTVRYRPGVHELEVGGDWYQVIPLGDGRLAVSVGDVVGRGLEAAVAMGQLRSAIAALTAASSKPAEVLEALDRLAVQVEGAQLATVVYAVLDPASGELAYGCAGHLPPLVVMPDGRSWYLEEGRTTPLGVSQESLPVGARTTLPPDARLVLYTDGLVERRSSSLDEGLARLAEVAGAACADDPDGLCDRILTALLETERGRDDVALLCLARLADCVLARRVPAVPEALASLRGELGATLRELGVDAEASRDLVLACGEALANAVEHSASPGSSGEVLLQLDVAEPNELRLKVRDFGAWREDGSGPERGRGVGIMRALADRVDIDRRAGGTTVLLHKRVEVTHPLSAAGRE